jgi:hypothetical protein
MSMPTEDGAARVVAAYLTVKAGYQEVSPLERMVRIRINRIAEEIANEVVDGLPSLREIVRTQVNAVVAAALRDDAYLSKVVTEAVALGLRKFVTQESDE